MNNPYTALAAIIRESWLDKAACNPETAHLFETYTGRRHNYREAMDICRTCPVRRQCLDHAIMHGEVTGIWGGKTPEQRRHLKVVS